MRQLICHVKPPPDRGTDKSPFGALSRARGTQAGANDERQPSPHRRGKDGVVPKHQLEARPRLRVDPQAASAAAVARILGVTEAEFRRALPELARHGFPAPIPVIQTYDLVALRRWLDKQNAALFRDDPHAGLAIDASQIDFDARLNRMGARNGEQR